MSTGPNHNSRKPRAKPEPGRGSHLPLCSYLLKSAVGQLCAEEESNVLSEPPLTGSQHRG